MAHNAARIPRQKRIFKRRDAGCALPIVAFTIAIAASICVQSPPVALAEEIDIYPEADEFQLEVERTAAEYEEALANVEAAGRQLDENRAKISELEEAIPAQAARSAQAAREQYKLQQQGSGLLDLLLGADSFGDFLANFEYVYRISEANIHEMNRLTTMKVELDETQAALRQAKREADENAEAASAALAAAQEARQEAQRRAQEEAQRQAEEAAAAAAAAAAEQAQEQEEDPEQAQGATTDEQQEKSAQSTEPEESPETSAEPEEEPDDSTTDSDAVSAPSNDGADWSEDQSAFVDEWAARIDAYLAGSPMAGQGRSFAVAAWTYGVDPRWSPAIACVESTKGAACFNPYNAWGWGSASWSSWEAAIDEHVCGLARGYGYTISIEAAQKYCPPNWQKWYEATSAQMNQI